MLGRSGGGRVASEDGHADSAVGMELRGIEGVAIDLLGAVRGSRMQGETTRCSAVSLSLCRTLHLSFSVRVCLSMVCLLSWFVLARGQPRAFAPMLVPYQNLIRKVLYSHRGMVGICWSARAVSNWD